jgi:hypothetical protein
MSCSIEIAEMLRGVDENGRSVRTETKALNDFSTITATFNQV